MSTTYSLNCSETTCKLWHLLSDKRALTNRIRLAKIDPNLLFLMVLLLVRTKRSKGEHLEASLLGWINALYNAFFLRMHLDSNLQQTVVLLHDEVSR